MRCEAIKKPIFESPAQRQDNTRFTPIRFFLASFYRLFTD
jgi:hypothetical protein